MKVILQATARVIARRFGYVLAVAIGIAAPGEILLMATSGDSSGLTAIVGAVVSLVASVTLVLVLVRDLQLRPLALRSVVPSVVSASLRTIGAFLILVPLLVVLVLAYLVLWSSSGRSAALLSGAILLAEVLLAPLSLVVPVCLNEEGGPRWALGRAWAMAAPKRGQTRLLLGGLSVLTWGLLWFLRSFGQAIGSPAGIVVVAVVSDVLSAGLLAVLYDVLTAEPSSIPAT